MALTLPEHVIRGLRKLHSDLAWAIVAQFEKRGVVPNGNPRADTELLTIAERESLIVINRALFKRLPGVDIVPLAADRAFLALEPGCGVSDLESAVAARLDAVRTGTPERQALLHFRRQLKAWRHDHSLRFHTRVIIVVEREGAPVKRLRTGR